jgi:hypothetical protein
MQWYIGLPPDFTREYQRFDPAIEAALTNAVKEALAVSGGSSPGPGSAHVAGIDAAEIPHDVGVP